MTRKIFLPLLAMALLLWAVGCSENSAESPQPDELSLDEDFGGYLATNESPAFDDPDLMASEEDETEYDDPLAFSPEIQELENDPSAGAFHLRAVWGNLRFDSTDTDLTDWTGSLEVSRGGIVIRRTIRFELGQDYIVPRVQRDLLEFVSQTSVHHDGIVTDLLIPELEPVIDTTVNYEVDSLGDTTEVIVIDTIPPDPEPVTVTFRTGPYSNTFSLGDLVALDTVIDLADGNQVAFTSFQYSRCPKGALAGFWGHDENGRGVFRGRWISQTGLVVGWVRGHYGVNSDGDRVLFGKWISRNGQFEGFLSGTYEPHPSENASDVAQGRAGGKFEARIYAANRTEIGQVRGHYKSSHRFRIGYFQGRWALDCPQTDNTGGEGSIVF
ncbi:hypothetical protein GF420_07700 [candidate division GN15 bacterium]|nr:hypothetical protein [candidate division GN15 bacterium]